MSKLATAATATLIAEYLAQGGKITRCPTVTAANANGLAVWAGTRLTGKAVSN